VPPLARVAAERLCAIRFEDVPAAVIEAAKDRFLDQLGVGVVASTLAAARALSEAVPRLGGAGGTSTALGLREPLPAASAALRNGALMHALEFDGTHVASIVHAGSVAAPAALALTEQMGASGPALLRAFVLGCELHIRLGLAAPGRFQARGFQLTSVGGPFASAVTAGLLLDLPADKLTHALGIAGSQASGVFEFVFEGATVKGLHPGWAAHAGVVAAELARAGMTGPATILEGPYGFFRAYADAPDAPEKLRELLGGLGREWYLPEMAIKQYPCCHYIQPFLECLDRLIGQGLDPRAVRELCCEVPRGEEFLICEPWARKLNPGSAYEAKFSLPYALAALMVDRRIAVETFEGPARSDLTAAARRISWKPMVDGGFPERYRARITVTTEAGETLTAAVDDVRGGPRRPLERGLIHDKFRDNAARALEDGAVDAVFRAVLELPTAASCATLTDALRRVRRPA
jgi:2-methylcitrate dehydratase PrpD